MPGIVLNAWDSARKMTGKVSTLVNVNNLLERYFKTNKNMGYKCYEEKLKRVKLRTYNAPVPLLRTQIGYSNSLF